MPIKIDHTLCSWSGGRFTKEPPCNENSYSCVEICPVQALARNNQLEFDPTKCIDCGSCAAVCPHQALSMDF